MHEISFSSNNDYIKAFITIQNGTFKSHHSTTVNVDLMVYQNVTSGMVVAVSLDFKTDGGYQRLVSTEIDFCAPGVSYADDPMLSILIETVKLYGNITITCPFFAEYYVLKEYPLDANKNIINLAPPGNFRVGVAAKHRVSRRKAIPVFNAIMDISIVADEGEDIEGAATADDDDEDLEDF
ncbi:uncharacterized protein LOC129765537 [Toxorhynchites rutilus septentrionalis]|uniref:uncharacterized protein LOC129765537 n=1 Tax=Toxorhynchites rutilus septentrionalis TaxID=329112 RepID=UPI002479F8AF|nr:uncharacterized protein LOC129765537 [Toxorhynchites rutilus septentrionalis]